MGVIAKRPLANVAWRYARKPAESYYQDYWARLRALDYDVPEGRCGGGDGAAVHAERAGRAHGDRRHDQAGSLAGERRAAGGGPVAGAEFERIRARWRQVADASWEGQV